MCRLHDDTPSLMRVWFLELWEGCVAQYAVYSHRATGAISQGGYWHWILKRRGLGIGCWSLGNCNSWHLWQLSPLQLDLRIQLCMVVRMCVCLLECICVYEAIWSAVKISTVEVLGIRLVLTKYHLEWAGYPFLSPLPIGHFGHMKTIHQFTMNRQFFKIILDLVHTRYQIPDKSLLCIFNFVGPGYFTIV